LYKGAEIVVISTARAASRAAKRLRKKKDGEEDLLGQAEEHSEQEQTQQAVVLPGGRLAVAKRINTGERLKAMGNNNCTVMKHLEATRQQREQREQVISS
jgi:hypothetical protein